ncbi:site-2 protease family protein [Mesorhizobium waimense]|uniref:site-2 protease family protein n=1 Tax=Mesorhizobium waimense TaxID=1300307 RepID=UPI00142D7E56
MFLSVFLHELAHVRAARRLGIGTERIELYLFGGLTHFKSTRPVKPQPYMWARIAFAGPLTNFILAVAFAACCYLTLGSLRPLASDRPFGWLALRPASPLAWTFWLGALLNLVLAILNVLGFSVGWRHDRQGLAFASLRRASGGADRRHLRHGTVGSSLRHNPASGSRRCSVVVPPRRSNRTGQLFAAKSGKAHRAVVCQGWRSQTGRGRACRLEG